jgi:type I restriction enzyme M protein
LFIDGLNEVTRERAFSFLNEKNQQNICDAFFADKDVESFSRRVSLSEIEENQFDLTVHRYVERKSGMVGVEFADALVGFQQAHKDLNSAMKKMESVIKAGL